MTGKPDERRMLKYDLVVLGAGPAGEKGAARAAYFGKRVAVVDPSPRPGGTAVSTGGIPTKTLREGAIYLQGLGQSAIGAGPEQADRLGARRPRRRLRPALGGGLGRVVLRDVLRLAHGAPQGGARLGAREALVSVYVEVAACDPEAIGGHVGEGLP